MSTDFTTKFPTIFPGFILDKSNDFILLQEVDRNSKRSYFTNEFENISTILSSHSNVFAENFYRDLFNLIGFKFNNTNFESNNFAHIDLIDNINKQAIQVTSQNDNTKIKEAIDGFFAKPENQYYKLQILLISKDAKN